MVLKDKIIVITGASRGLGEVLAKDLATKGAKLVIAGRNTEELNSVAKSIAGSTEVLAVSTDVTKEVEVKSLAQKTVEKFGRIDIWINNAGLWLPRGIVEEIDISKAHDILEVNLFGTAYGSREAIRVMKKQKAGLIVNIVSTAALQGRPEQAFYSASKHAERGFTDSIREELKDLNIKVIGIYPGGIKTHLFDEQKPADFAEFMEPEYVCQKIIENLEKDNPLDEIVLRRPGQK